MATDADQKKGLTKNSKIKGEIRASIKYEGLLEVTCLLDPDTRKLLKKYCIKLGYNDPSRPKARKVETYSQVITQLIQEKLSKSTSMTVPRSRKALELYRLHAIVKHITSQKKGLTDEDAAEYMTNRNYLRPKFVISGTKPKPSERPWTKSDIKKLMNIEMVSKKIEELNQGD